MMRSRQANKSRYPAHHTAPSGPKLWNSEDFYCYSIILGAMNKKGVDVIRISELLSGTVSKVLRCVTTALGCMVSKFSLTENRYSLCKNLETVSVHRSNSQNGIDVVT